MSKLVKEADLFKSTLLFIFAICSLVNKSNTRYLFKNMPAY